MNDIKNIIKILKKRKVSHYKIIKNISKKFIYKNVYGKILTEETLESRIFVVFNYKNRSLKFSIPSGQPQILIERCVDSIISNSNKYWGTWKDFAFKNKVQNFKNSTYFLNFSVSSYLRWLKKETKKISKNVEFSFNFVYSSEFNKYILQTPEKYLEQYKSTSECICMENKNFEKKVILSDYFLNENLAKIIILNFSRKNPSLMNIDLRKNGNFAIEAKAFSQILNAYIKIYYANNVFLGQSFINLNQLNTQISKIKFNMGVMPYKAIYFDGEGNNTLKKLIIKSGKLVNFVSNSDNSRYLGINSYGDADLDYPQNISHQRLFFKFMENNYNFNKSNIVIKNFEYIYVDYSDQSFKGIAIYSHNQKIHKTPFNISISYLFDNVYPLNNVYKHYKNVHCPSVLIVNN